MKIYVLFECGHYVDEEGFPVWATPDVDAAIAEMRKRDELERRVNGYKFSSFSLYEFDSHGPSDKGIEWFFSERMELIRDGHVVTPQADGATTPPDTE